MRGVHHSELGRNLVVDHPHAQAFQPVEEVPGDGRDAHHGHWQDFLNVRDLCVVWGDNVASGVYRDMEFHNDTWTCWASWPDRATGQRFHIDQLSNNHLLADIPAVNQALLDAEPGDHVRIRGLLANYRNLGNGFRRGTSTTREDSGNGACETIYVRDFQVVNKANTGWRRVYGFSQWLAGLSLVGFLVLLPVTPVRRHR